MKQTRTAKKAPKQRISRIHKKLDEFIQASLDKYAFCEAPTEMLSSTGKFSRIVVSNKSAIPDLVIFNKKFNKAECFYNSKEETNIPFPRFRYILRAKQSVEQKEKLEQKDKAVEYRENLGQKGRKVSDEADPEWMDIDVNELDNHKMEFKALPGQKDCSNPDTLIEDLTNMLKIEETPEKVPEVFENSELIVQSNMRDLLDFDDELSEDSVKSAEKVVESADQAVKFSKHFSSDGQVYKPLFLNRPFPVAQPILMPYPVPGQYVYAEPKEPVFPSSFLENPENIIMKNLIKPSWVVKMKDIVVERKNSLDLLHFLESNKKEGNSLSAYWINDLETDIHFKPQIILESLKEMRDTMHQRLAEGSRAGEDKAYMPVGFYSMPGVEGPQMSVNMMNRAYEPRNVATK